MPDLYGFAEELSTRIESAKTTRDVEYILYDIESLAIPKDDKLFVLDIVIRNCDNKKYIELIRYIKERIRKGK